MRLTVTTAAAMALTASWLPAQIDGSWEGAIRIQGIELGIVVHFTTTDGALAATIDIPQQGASGVPLEEVRYEHPDVHFELAAPVGRAVFDGKMDADSIAGDFSQAGQMATFSLRRQRANRDAGPAADLPYAADEVEFFHGGLRLAGTLTVPPGGGPHPAAVMITGSGAQNRDEELFGFKPFRIIADHLTRHGIAVLRYDDRGVGGSEGSVSESTSEDFAGDAIAAVRFLTRDPRIDASRIGLVGHSEGGLVATLAASRTPEIAFTVLLAGPALTGAEIIHAQGERIMRANGADDTAIATFHRNQERVFEALRTDRGWDEVEAMLLEQARTALANQPEGRREELAAAQVQAQLNQVRSPWFRHFYTLDPRDALRTSRAPLLAVFGELDLQVPPDVNRPEMERVLSSAEHPDFTIRVLPDANHLFQRAVTGSPTEYATLEKVFVPGFLELITGWIAERTGLTP